MYLCLLNICLIKQPHSLSPPWTVIHDAPFPLPTLVSSGFWGRFCCSLIFPPQRVPGTLHLALVESGWYYRDFEGTKRLFLAAWATSASMGSLPVFWPSPHDLHLMAFQSCGKSCHCETLYWVGSASMGIRFEDRLMQFMKLYSGGATSTAYIRSKRLSVYVDVLLGILVRILARSFKG